MKKIVALLLAVVMLLGLCACGSTSEKNEDTKAPEQTAANDASIETEKEAAPDTITVLAPPVMNDYANYVRTAAEEYVKTHPNITVEVIETTWADHQDKMTTMCLAGEAPDISYSETGWLGTYVEMGVGVDLKEYMDADMLADYDEGTLSYTTLDDTLYAVPLYISIQALGGNKAMLEEAGVDVEKVQSQGWSYDEFLEAIKNGTKDGTWGFVFANQGITTADFVNIFGGVAGLTGSFSDELKYAYTSENMLNLLKVMEEITSSGYMPNYTVAAGERLVMLQKGETMVTGKAMPLFETNCRTSTAAVQNGTAEEGFIEMEYVFLPMPTLDGVKANCYGGGGLLVPFRNANTTDEHLKNVVEFYHYLSSGQCAADVCDAVMLPALCESGRKAQENSELVQSEGNAIASAYCTSILVAPPTGITAEQSANAETILNEVIVPKMEALIAGEATAEEVYKVICNEAFALFGEENCETGLIG